MPNRAEDLRTAPRRTADCTVELTWKTESGEKLFDSCRALDVSDSGVAVECSEAIPPGTKLILWAAAFQVAALAEVRYCAWRKSIYVLGLHFKARTTTARHDRCAPDHYELLRLSPHAEPETIERVYRTLARRFHPDNQVTGDADAFLRVSEAYRILSDPRRRAVYDAERQAPRQTPRFQLIAAEFFHGIRGEQNRRLAAMCLLYRKRSSSFDAPGLSLLDLEQMTGCTREELGFALWYLCERKLARVGDNTEYCLTAEGVDLLEEKLAAEQASELRALAAVSAPRALSAGIS